VGPPQPLRPLAAERFWTLVPALLAGEAPEPDAVTLPDRFYDLLGDLIGTPRAAPTPLEDLGPLPRSGSLISQAAPPTPWQQVGRAWSELWPAWLGASLLGLTWTRDRRRPEVPGRKRTLEP
jgi:hypothetical protein